MVMRIKNIITIRKTVAAIAVLVLMLSTSIAVYATEIEGDGGSQTLTVNLEAPTWTLVIPADVNITKWESSYDIGTVGIQVDEENRALLRETDEITAYMKVPEIVGEKYLYLVKTDDDNKNIPFTLHIVSPNLQPNKEIDWEEYDVPEKYNGNVRIAVFYGALKDQEGYACSSERMIMTIKEVDWNNASYGTYQITLTYSSKLRSSPL